MSAKSSHWRDFGPIGVVLRLLELERNGCGAIKTPCPQKGKGRSLHTDRLLSAGIPPPCRWSGARIYLETPAVKPRMSWREKMMYITNIGTIAIVSAASMAL